MGDVGRRFAEHRAAVVGLVVLVVLVLFAFAGPLAWSYDHTLHREIVGDRSPSLEHPFGTSRLGHDLLGQVMRGTQQSLKVGAIAALLTAAIGTAWGLVAGYYGGRLGALMMRLVDVFLIVPILVVALVLAGRPGGSSWLQIALVIGLFGWVTTARIVRSLVLSLREQEFVQAARAMGASDRRIIGRHLVPHVAGAVVVDGTLAVTLAVLLEASLSFVGFGITAPDTSLGLLVSSGRGTVFTRPWLFYFPGATLIALCVAVNLVGDGLRDALDPRR